MKTITHKINLPSYVIIILLLVHSFAMGQTPIKSTAVSVDMGVTNTDSQTASALNSDSCSANDFTLGNFFLADINGNPLDNNCTPGTPQNAYIFAFFNANTGAGRYSLYIDYDVFINGAFSYHVNDCLYEGQALPVGQNTQVQQITWNCGDQIQLRNFYMSWQPNPGRPCAPNPSKCYFDANGFQVNAPLIANFSSAMVCNSYQVQFTDGTTGGDVDNPYSYVWNFGDGSPNSNAQNPLHTFPGPGDYTVTLTVTDNDGVVDDQSYNVTVQPSLVGLTLDASSVPCDGGTTGTITANGVSGGFGAYTYSISPEPAGFIQNNNVFSNLPSGTYTVTVTDENNCSISEDATITVGDNTAPIINAPDTINVEGCDVDDVTNGALTALPYSSTPSIITELQFLDEGGTFTEDNVAEITYQDTASGTCPVVITREFTITDDCGQSASDTQTITVDDTTVPTASNPEAISVQCIDDVPAADISVVTDAADNCSTPVVAFVSDSSDGQSCPETITRTYSVTDDCNNSIEVTQTITVGDTIAPTASNPGAISVQCIDDVPAADISVVTDAADNCSTPVVAFVGDSSDGQSCPETITRTYSVTDDCNNSIEVTQTITVSDTIAPTASNPGAISVQCIDDVPAADISVVTDAADNCSTPVVAFVGDSSDGQTCPETITRTYSVTDACNNSIEVTQTITVHDTTAPSITTVGADQTVLCDGTGNTQEFQAWLDTNAGANATDNCSNVTWTYEILNVIDQCGETSRTLVRFIATDDCDNTNSTTALFTILDLVPPTLDSPAADLTVECDSSGNTTDLNDWLNNNGGATATDICSNVTWSNDFTGLSDDCGETGSATVTFTATDDCGNEVSSTATFTIQDTQNPVAPSAPADITYECLDDLPAAGDLTATDNCAGDITVTGVDVTDDSNPCNVVITRTWTFTDDCNNTSSVSQTITVTDTIAPTIDTPASDIAIECDGSGNNGAIEDWINNNGGAVASDNCGDVTWTNNYGGTASDCSAAIEVTFTATDACGNTTSTTASYAIQDNEAPDVTPASNETVECDGSGNLTDLNNWLSNNGGATATDDCSAVAWSNDFTALSDECGETGSATVTFTATDGCGNSSSTTATFTIEDTIAPTAPNAPGDITYECIGDVPAPGDLTATDECSGDITATAVDITDDSNPCNVVITRTWTFTDDCNNSSSVSQTITVADTIAPVAPSAPADVTYECVGDVPAPSDLIAVDNCAGDIVATAVDATDDTNPCNIVITRTWTFTDDCNNSSSISQTITVTDTIPPVAPSAPADITYECVDDVPAPGDLIAVDNCAGDIVATAVDATDDSNPCNVVITRTWTFTDDCNNTSSVSQTITVTDSVAPTIDAPASDISIECDGSGNNGAIEDWLNSNGGATASDNCSDVTWTNNYGGTSSDCSAAIEVTFTATDACGNATSVTASYAIQDTEAPDVTPAADATVECDGSGNLSELNDWLNNNGGATATDDCSAVSWSNDFTALSDECGETGSATVTFTATDGCGNEASTTATFTIEDTVAPVAPSAPADIAYECIGDVPAPGDLTATDECSGDITATAVDTTDDSNPCNVVITRTWTFTDDCNNSSSVSQTITVADTIAPTASIPDSITVECIGDVPAADISVVTDTADNCSTPVVAFVGDSSDGQSCPETITRTYSVTDACNNSIEVTQTITVGDTIAPTASNPESIAIDCIGDIPAADISVVTDAADNCSTPVVTFVGDSSDGQSCPETITRTYSVTDACNNSIEVTQTITVGDTIAPTASNPEAISVQCIDDVPAADISVVTDAADNCSEPVVAFVGDSSDGQSCPETITRTYSVTDACNNSIEVTQTITVGDTIAPTASNPEAISVQCIDDVPAADISVVTDAADNCSTPVVAFVSDSSDGQSCPETITRTYSVTDACNNAIEVTQTITVGDTIAPTASNPESIAIECIGDIPAADISVVTDAADNCSTPVVAFVGDSSDGQSCPETITRTYSVTDACNNSIEVTQTITVGDTIAPTASNPEAISVQCIDDVPAADISVVTDAADNCSEPVVTFVGDSSDGQSCPETITRTYSVTDACNNSIEVTQTITVGDTIAPDAPEAPADVTYSCIVDVPDMMPLSTTDNCDGVITSQGVETMDNSDLCNVVITRTWDFVDACGNSTSVSQTISVIDTTPPSVTNDLSDISVTCDEIPEPPVLEFDACSTNVEIIGDNPQVTSTFDINNPGDYQITWTWNVIDHCNLKAVFTQNVFVEFQDFVTTRTDDKCTDDGAIDLFEYYSGSDTSGTWEVISGDTTLDGSIFDPLEVELGDYIFSYSVEDNGCLSTTEVVITVNDDCVVLPCNDITVSTAVTPNGDQWNEYFEVLGIEECGFEIDLKIFNRWGAMILEASSYQNDWNGTAHSSSFGNSDKVPTGTYYYIINLKNSGLKPITGYFYVGTK